MVGTGLAVFSNILFRLCIMCKFIDFMEVEDVLSNVKYHIVRRIHTNKKASVQRRMFLRSIIQLVFFGDIQSIIDRQNGPIA